MFREQPNSNPETHWLLISATEGSFLVSMIRKRNYAKKEIDIVFCSTWTYVSHSGAFLAGPPCKHYHWTLLTAHKWIRVPAQSKAPTTCLNRFKAYYGL